MYLIKVSSFIMDEQTVYLFALVSEVLQFIKTS